MLARHKCLKVFPVLKSVYFPPSCLHLSPSLSAKDSCPWANTWLLKALCWNATLSHDAGPVTGLTVVSRASAPFFWWRGSPPCPVSSPKLCALLLADLPCTGERQQVSASTLAKCFQSTECIWAEMCLQTRYSIKLVIVRVWTAWGNRHIWHGEWDQISELHSLHLTKDMLDINLDGWHQCEMWDLIPWEVHHKFQMTRMENTICFHSCANKYLNHVLQSFLWQTQQITPICGK